MIIIASFETIFGSRVIQFSKSSIFEYGGSKKTMSKVELESVHTY